MEKNEKLSKEYGLTIYNSQNKQFPYFVEEWDECFTEDEIKHHIKDWNMIEGIQLENE